MRFLASIPELCDITFLVGETREPVCAVKAVLAARSRLVIGYYLEGISEIVKYSVDKIYLFKRIYINFNQ